jgi:hypothetical protein
VRALFSNSQARGLDQYRVMRAAVADDVRRFKRSTSQQKRLMKMHDTATDCVAPKFYKKQFLIAELICAGQLAYAGTFLPPYSFFIADRNSGIL